jgi:predicted MFS family arabinose efflux permease
LSRVIGVPGIFYMIGVLALLAMVVVARLPDPQPHESGAQRSPVPLASILRDRELNRLSVGIFVLHAVLMALFIAVPFDLVSDGLAADEHWKVYAAVMLGSLLFMVPAVHYGDRKGRSKSVFLASIVLVLASQVILLRLTGSLIGTAGALLVFFAGFMVLEAALPSHVSRAAPAGARGAAIAVYSTIQFLGAAFGGALGGYVMQHSGRPALLGMNLALIVLWLAVASGMRPAGSLSARTYPVPPMDGERAVGLGERLGALPGVEEARVHAAAGMAYLKVDPGSFDERDVLKLIAGES